MGGRLLGSASRRLRRLFALTQPLLLDQLVRRGLDAHLDIAALLDPVIEDRSLASAVGARQLALTPGIFAQAGGRGGGDIVAPLARRLAAAGAGVAVEVRAGWLRMADDLAGLQQHRLAASLTGPLALTPFAFRHDFPHSGEAGELAHGAR